MVAGRSFYFWMPLWDRALWQLELIVLSGRGTSNCYLLVTNKIDIDILNPLSLHCCIAVREKERERESAEIEGQGSSRCLGSISWIIVVPPGLDVHPLSDRALS